MNIIYHLRRNKWLLLFLLVLPIVSALADDPPPPPTSDQIALWEQNLGLMAQIFGAFSVVAGVAVTASAIYGFKRCAQMRTMMTPQASMVGPMVKFFGGVLLLALPTMINTSLLAFWGTSSPLANPYEGSSSPLAAIYTPVMMAFRLVGVGFFIRGIFALSKTGGQGQPGAVGKAMIYLFTAVLLIHIQGTIDLVGTFFGYSG